MSDNHLTETVKSLTNKVLDKNITASNLRALYPFSIRLATYRRSKGYSYEYLASEIGCAKSTIFVLEHNTLEYCGISILSRIAVYFGCELTDWLSPVKEKEEIKSDKSPFEDKSA